MAKVLADELRLPLDIVVPRKIGHPNHPEYAIGALTEDGNVHLDPQSLRWSGLTEPDPRVQRVIADERKEAQRRLSVYRAKRPPLNLVGKTVIIIDDGIATGATMKAAIKSAKAKSASKVVVATPVAAPDTLRDLAKMGAELVVLLTPDPFQAVGLWYREFEQTSDEEVLEIMRATDARAGEFAMPSKPEAAPADGAKVVGSGSGSESALSGFSAVQAFAAKLMPSLGLGGVVHDKATLPEQEKAKENRDR